MLHAVHEEGPGIALPSDSKAGKTCVHFSPLDVALVGSAADGSLHTWDTATLQAQDNYRALHKVSRLPCCVFRCNCHSTIIKLVQDSAVHATNVDGKNTECMRHVWLSVYKYFRA